MLSLLTTALALFGAASARPVPPTKEIQPLRRRDTPTAAPWFSYYDDRPADGFPDPGTLTGWNVFNLGFWLSTSGAFDLALEFAQMSADDRTTMLTNFHDNGLLLFVTAFGSTDNPTSQGADATTTAQNFAAYVTTNGLDGVDIDWEDKAAFEDPAGSGFNWLITFTNTLRAALPDSVFISHSPVAPWFTTNTAMYPAGNYVGVDQQTNGAIDFYNIQFYNQGTSAYTDCTSIVSDSASNPDLTGYPGASLLEMMASGVASSKLLLGKPGNTGDASSGYVDPATLAGCVQQAKAGGWNGGLMIWEYPDASAGYVSTVWGS